MADTDFELKGMLEIVEVDDSEADDAAKRREKVAVSSGGDVSPAEADQQQSIVAGGVTKGLAASAIVAGLLSQLKSISGFVNAVFGVISRALIPSVEGLAEILRPVISAVNSFLSDPAGFLSPDVSTEGGITEPLDAGSSSPLQAGPGSVGETDATEALDLGGLFDGFFNFNTADQTGEVTKQLFKQNAEDATRDKTGAFN